VPCSDLLPEADFQQSQILFDIMSVANPEIVTIPYEQRKKEPTRHNLGRLARFDWSPHPSSGEVFAGDVVETGPVPASDLPTPLGYLLERVERDLDLTAASEIVERSVVEDGIAVLRDHASAPRQNLHESGRTAHLAYLLAVLLD
jgi:hypothetical protein